MNNKQKKIIYRIIFAATLIIIAWLLPLTGLWQTALFVVSYLLVGYDVLWSAIRHILRGQIFDEQFLMTIATLGALAIGEYPEAAGVMLFYQVGELFESLAVGKSRRSIAALMDIRPDYAVVLREGREETVAPDEVVPGEIIIVRPGERIPLDGEVVSGHTALNTSALTGESLPRDVGSGDLVISGSINLSGVIWVQVASCYAESTVAKILELAENSAEKKARAESFINRFARYYTPCVVVGAVLLALLPPLLFSQSWSVWVNRALIFLMVSCPCALVISVPLSFFGGIGGASRYGILIKGANYLEALAGVDTVVFDKTGTLTKGVFAVSEVCPTTVSGEQLLDIAATAESYSHHPIAESIVAAYDKKIDKSRLGIVTELAGRGVQAEVDGQNIYIGNAALMQQVGAGLMHDCSMTGTVIHVAQNSNYLGHLVVSDELKTDAPQVITALRAQGVKKIIMLTGDEERVALSVGQAAGIDDVRAGLLPAQKVEQVEMLIEQGAKLVFVGDGVNDAPVLARADVGVAMGALGSDAAIESADVVLMDDKLEKLSLAINLSRRTMRIVRQNIVFALLVKAVLLVLGAFGIVDMWAAVFGDVGVMVLAVLNAMRAMLPVR